jgi:hypothetical protein
MERFLKIPATVVLMAWVAVIGATFPAKVSAQVLYWSITGTVTGESGAVVPAAKVDVVNENTGLRREVTTDTVGIYRLLLLNGLHSCLNTTSGSTRAARRAGR